MVAIMSAAMLMSSVTVSMAFPVGVYAEELADNLEGQTTSIGYGDTMKNNWGTILSNEGTLLTNHIGGAVSGGNVTENYGTAIDVLNVDNNYNSGTVTGSDSQVTNNFGTVNGIGQVTNNYGTAIDSSVVNNYSSGIVKQVNSESVNVGENYGGSIEGTVSVDDTLGENAGPDAIRINQQDPKPVSPAEIRVPQPDSETDTITIDVKPDQPSLGDSVEAELIDMINKKMDTTATNVTIYFGENTFVTKDMLKAMVNKGKKVSCVFIHNGETYILSISRYTNLSAGEIDSVFAKNLIFTGDGFLTIQQLFDEYMDLMVISEYASSIVIRNRLGDNVDGVTLDEQAALYEKSFTRFIASGRSVEDAEHLATDITSIFTNIRSKVNIPEDFTSQQVSEFKAIFIDAYLKAAEDGNNMIKVYVEATNLARKKMGLETQLPPIAITNANAETAVSAEKSAAKAETTAITNANAAIAPVSNNLYIFDANAYAASTSNKEVFVPYIYQDEAKWDDAKMREIANQSDPGMRELVYQDMKEKKGKWVRYGADGKMLKGWVTIGGDLAELYPDQAGNTYYYDTVTGTMARGTITIDGVSYYFNKSTGVLDG